MTRRRQQRMRGKDGETFDPTTGEVLPPFRQVERVAITFIGQGKTRQEMAEQCDINRIMRRWRESGQLPQVNSMQASYGDFTGATDYQTAVNKIQAAEDRFMALPSEVRELCRNDPAEFLRLVDDDAGLEQLHEAGLDVKPPGWSKAKKSRDDEERPKGATANAQQGDQKPQDAPREPAQQAAKAE